MKTHELLKKYWDRKRKGRDGLSLRSLARHLDVSPSFLSRIFSGQKPLPYDLLLKMRDTLDIESDVFSTLEDAYRILPRRNESRSKTVSTELEEWDLAGLRSFNVLRQWFYIPILELTNLSGYDGSIAVIAKRLNLALPTAEVAVRELIAAGLLAEDENGRLRKTKRKVRFSSAKSRDSIRGFHGQMLDKAKSQLKTAISDEDFARRLITGITVTASSKKIEEAKRKLTECLHAIANDLIEDDGDQVYQLSAQLFPLTTK